ncbi:probable G-protein coupled receptor Mth-like 6 [Eurytemora carolleeae]|uniref:probable G-protein coupled receptor Mth-like 6 n=1 Tax=Eurytemora carolleeae TaxID=1294199 RepID=UPI000C788A0D|nr:probable G-protein coupled receptor Mth-like 6 [Eurytemora carolleeae]|eukprot:XP_023325815.1 probable G-protein coupled receptor Mth-like 6 [Eurytemora affinis]
MNTREYDILPFMNDRPLPEDYEQIQKENQTKDICKPILQAQSDTSMLKIFQNRKQLSWTAGINYRLVAPKKDFFQCPMDPITKEIASLTAIDGDPILLGTGGLDGVIDSNDENGRKTILPPETFCLSVNDPDPVFLQCVFSPEIDKCEAIRFWVFNCAFILSIIFIILAIIAHFIEPLLKNTALGTLSIGFLFNLLMTYIIMIISRLATFERETPPCVLIGYLQQYFYLSFFTWNNAIAIIIGQKLTTSRNRDSKKKQIICIIYAQGLPAVICVLTYIIDLFVPEEGPNRAYFPEMGVYSCYLGSERTAVRPHYFLSPEFLYVQGFQLLLLLINLTWFIRAAMFIVKNRTTVGESDVNKQKENYVIVLKLFIHMCSLWICEIITSAIAVEYGVIETCKLRFVLDSPNAFYGVLIFLFLIVGKKAVRKNLQETVSSWFSSSKEVNTEVGYSANGRSSDESKVTLSTRFKK